MKLYHYCPKGNTVLRDGLLCTAKSPRGLKPYANRAGSEKEEDIIKWLDTSFYGRSRSVSVLTERVKYEGNDPRLKSWADFDLFSINVDALIKDGLLEAIWCKNGSDEHGNNEVLFQIRPEDIDFSPLDWHKVNYEKGLLFAVIRHYMLVMKNGVIPPQYLTLEKNS